MTQPDIFAVERMTPEQYSEFVVRLARLPADVLAEERRGALRIIAGGGDKLENYLAYHELVHGAPLPNHVLPAVQNRFEAHERGEMFLWLGFRGVLKTTTILTIDSFLIGHHPEGTGIITGASDDNAVTNAKFIANIMDLHPEFKLVFPSVVVDKARGWGADGYWVRRTHDTDGREISEGEWRARQSKVVDPTFLGGGYKSAKVNGRHPSLFLTVDDLHDIDTSASSVEREYIKLVFFTQILKTVIRREDKLLTQVDVTGVPFAKDDSYAQLRVMGGVTVYVQPVMRAAAEGAEGAVYLDGVNEKTGITYDDIVGWWFLTWAQNFGAQSIINARSEGKAGFWQMFMLDIHAAKTGGLTYYLYDHTKIGYDLPTVGGADPSGIDPDTEVGGQKRSSFALCYLCKLQHGGAVVKDGVLKPLGIVKAKDAILQAQTMFRNWETTGVEDVGVGKVFMQYLRTDSRVQFVASNLKSLGDAKIRDKKLRFLNELHPWIESGVIRISDENTPFLNALRYLMDNFFDIDAGKPHEALDAGDSLYHAAKLIPEILRMPVSEDISPLALTTHSGLWHPLMGRGVRNGYG